MGEHHSVHKPHHGQNKEVCLVAAKVKQVKKVVKLQIPAAKANPAPPVGPALGQAGVNIQQFCSQFNEKTASMAGYVIPVEIYVYEDRTFTFITKTPPASDLLKKAAGIQKGSDNAKKNKFLSFSLNWLIFSISVGGDSVRPHLGGKLTNGKKR